MQRILCIVGGMNAGGAETFLMKIYRRLDKTKYQMDFAVAENGIYDDEIISNGGKIYIITPKSEGLLKNFSDIQRIVKKEKYDKVLRISQNSLSALELFAAKLGGAKTRAFRSSNSNTVSGSKRDLVIHRLFRWMPLVFANVKFAPSTEAAEYMFGKGCITKGRATLLHNALDTSVFFYDLEKREKIRKEFDMEEQYVVGHVGRFNQQKNHEFLIEIFNEIHIKNPKSKLLLVGKGELEENIREKIKQLKLEESVIFTGIRNDIPDLLSAMDVFVFPSFYEGMPNTVIEAQATGLPCIIADTITKEANITGLVKYCSLNKNADYWAKETINILKNNRCDMSQVFKKNGYDIESVVENFLKIMKLF